MAMELAWQRVADELSGLNVWCFIAPLIASVAALPWTFYPFFGVLFDPGIGALIMGTPASLWLLIVSDGPRAPRIKQAIALFSSSFIMAITLCTLYRNIVG